MKIRFAIVGSDLLAQVRTEIDALLSAVNAGDMDGVDAATALLLKLTANCSSIDLSEDEWRKFLNKIRLKNPEFKSNYLLPGDICAPLFPKIAAGDYVLELPVDGDMEGEESDV
ncbi:hypothetical protein [Pusillimonas minor]|uniref:Uncharacterized protein n=1 Tax=Pusillimonas minor TaxID=2697024 RepID=A0A842HMY9_9BURK|nr:hypothetical protein [Pusillimonas minor]MBC2769606.1 hypothetical protein [Pusillimonas minor]